MIKRVMLELDNSLFFVIALVWILMIVLNKIYFKPVGKIIEEREENMAKESRQLDEMTREIEEKNVEIESILKDTRNDAALIREALIREGEKAREQLLAETREESKRNFARQMKKLEKEIAAAESKLEKEVEFFSKRIREIFV